MATGSDDKTVRVFEAATGEEVSRLAHQSPVFAVAFSPDGRWVATGSDDKTVRVFEAATGKEVSRLAHQDTVNAVAFSPDGRWVATGSDDKTARVFEAATGKERSRLELNRPVRALWLSRDGRQLLTVSHAASGLDLVLASHLLRPEDLTHEACSRLTRNLTSEEWKQYLGGEPYRQTCPNLP